MKNKYLLLFILSVMLVFIGGCNKLENESTSATKILLTALTGNDLSGNSGATTVFSDVVCTSGTIINDLGTASIQAVLLNPTATSASYYQDVVIDQIDVSYTRTENGRNVEGVDVPFGFSQKVNFMVGVGSSIDLPFMLVQHNAKMESPLVELTTWTNQEKILKLEAKVTIHARDVAGNRLESVVGYISVWCANYGDDC